MVCEQCGFVAADYDDRDDLLGTLRALTPIWRTMTEGVDPAVVAAVAPRAANIAAFDKEIARLCRDAEPDVLLPFLHDAIHEQRDAARALHARGAGAPHQQGTLVQINASGGGVPKRSVPSAIIGRRGVEGDAQAERRHHGRPFQALSLWSMDVIDALRAEGHDVSPGAAGENLTVGGIDWATIRPGVRIAVGAVRAEVSAFATPCAKNARWFSDGKFRRIDHNLHPGSSRAYAWVVTPGTVAVGDAVVVEPWIARVDVATFDEIAPEFRRRIEKTQWCTLTTVDRQGRPRGRIVHPVWEEPTGWLATFRRSFKAKHLAANPFVSLAYWDQEHEQVYVDCRTTWVDDGDTKQRLWDLYSVKPEGYALSGFWKGPDDPNYGLLRLDPWRIELWSVKGLFERTPPQVWRSPTS